jgi:hypothetical protein
VNLPEAKATLERVSFHGMKFHVNHHDDERMEADRRLLYFVIEHRVTDAATLKPTTIYTRFAEPADAFPDAERLLDFIWMNVKLRVLHEAGEFFLVDGKRVKDPHARDRAGMVPT